jgi:uncharacterized protein YndB with AHSA1/START domain
MRLVNPDVTTRCLPVIVDDIEPHVQATAIRRPTAILPVVGIGSYQMTAVVAGSPEHVFDTFVDDANFFALRPGAVEHREILPLATGGHSCVQVYDIGGQRVEQRSVNEVFERPARLVDVAEAPWGTTVVTTTFEPTASGDSTVRVHVETTREHRLGPVTAVLTKLSSRRRLRATLNALARLAESS